MRTLRLICLLFLLGGLLAIFVPGAALAQTPTPTPTPSPTTTPPQVTPTPEPTPAPEPTPILPPEEIEVLPTYPKIEAIAGSSFSFEVELRYLYGEVAKVFDLRVTGPKGWDIYMTPQYEKDKKISAIRLEPTFTVGTKILVFAQAPFYPLPDPGEYKIKLEAISGTLSGSSELTAVITAKYDLVLVPAIEGRYNTTAEAGKDSTYSIKAQNYGTSSMDKINFSSTQPDGWSITFSPDKVDTLAAFDEKSVDVKIKPAPKTIAGDYMITLNASSNQATAQVMNIRVTVESPTVWGWVGVGIILVVVVGMVTVFMRFSRR